MSPFLSSVFTAFTASHKSSGREELDAELAEARARVAELETRLTTLPSDLDVEAFLVESDKLMSGHATEAVLLNMLNARFGGAEEKAKPRRSSSSRTARRPRPAVAGVLQEGVPIPITMTPPAPVDAGAAEAAEVALSQDITRAEKDLILAQLTRESMSANEIAAATSQATGDTWESGDVSPILRALLDAGEIRFEGSSRAKRFMLLA